MTSRYRFACLFFTFLAVTASVSAQTESTASTIAVQMEQAEAQNRTDFSPYAITREYKFVDRENDPGFKSSVVAELTVLPPSSKKYIMEGTDGSGWGGTIVRTILDIEAVFARSPGASDITRAVQQAYVVAGVSPLAHSNPQNSVQQTPPAEGSASVAGTVLDVSGATVSGADVSLTHEDGTQLLTIVSEANGEFSFTNIPAGSYLVIVNAKGFAPFTSAEFAVAVQQAYEVPDVSLSITTANMEVTVRPTELIAAEQLRAEENQRLIGIIPNFYTSYIHDAAPLTWKQKFSLVARNSYDPVVFIGVGFGAGIEQATNAYAGYGQGATGYSKRYAARFVDGRSSDFLTHAVFPALFHQDPRYYYQGTGSLKSRFMHAVSSPFVTRSDSGQTVPNASYLLGDIGSGALSNLYYPKANRGANLVFTNAAVGLAGRVGTNLVREFLSKLLTRSVPGNGKL